MFNVVIKHVFGPGENPDNSSELVKNVRDIQTTYDQDDQILYIEYLEMVFDKKESKMVNVERERVFVLPRPMTLDVSAMINHLIKKTEPLLGTHPGANRVRDKFLKVEVKHFAEPLEGLYGEILNPTEDILSQVTLGLTIDGEHYDDGEVITYWSKIAA